MDIEDIIDIQKANGNFSVRQVAFNVPSTPDSKVSANLVKSLESGLTKTRCDGSTKKKLKKIRKRGKSPLPDVISWPSDSDITVLRMKLNMNSNDLQEKVGYALRGDGLHHPDEASMVNLATLIHQSQTPSKHSLNIEEYLLPLTSWEQQERLEQQTSVENNISKENLSRQNCTFNVYTARESVNLKPNNNDDPGESSMKSKVAKFLRLYFCPCCTCLYKIEKMNDKPSTYFAHEIYDTAKE